MIAPGARRHKPHRGSPIPAAARPGAAVPGSHATSACCLHAPVDDVPGRAGAHDLALRADGTVSLSTAPEPGSDCDAHAVPADAGEDAQSLGMDGWVSGVLYEREQDGDLVYGTRRLTGAREFLGFTVQTPPGVGRHMPDWGGWPRPGSTRGPRCSARRRAAMDWTRPGCVRSPRESDLQTRAVAQARARRDAADAGCDCRLSITGSSIPIRRRNRSAPAPAIYAGCCSATTATARVRWRRTTPARAPWTVTTACPYAGTRGSIKVQALYLRYREAIGHPVERPAR